MTFNFPYFDQAINSKDKFRKCSKAKIKTVSLRIEVVYGDTTRMKKDLLSELKYKTFEDGLETF